MEDTNQPITSSPPSSSGHNNPHPDPNDHLNQSSSDDVTFAFNHLHINNNSGSNPQHLIPEPSETDNNDEEEEDEDEDDEEEEEEEEEDDDDFTFMCVGDNDNNNGSTTTEALEGQIRNVFPLFDQSLLLSADYDDAKRRLPINVPVDKVFIESPRRSPSDNGETDGTVRALQKESEMSMKSNSTGFSKLWRFRNNEMNRSNSDGRDAFVFLEASDTATTSDGKQNAVKVNGGNVKGVKKGSKGKKLAASAHEVYLKQKKKGGQTEDERRRSYLPYRPGLMGFFTNVNGGLSKNVHPF